MRITLLIPPFLRTPIFPGPWFPRPIFPRILSPLHPSPFHLRCKKHVKMQVKLCFFSLFGSLVALAKPQIPVKMHVFSGWGQENTVKMQVFCFFWGPGAAKSSQLALLRCGCEATFSLLCKTRKHRKNAGFGPFFGLLGLWSHPPLNTEGFCNQVVFYRTQENHVKMQSKSLFLELGFPKKEQPNFLKIAFEGFCPFCKN